MSLVGFDHCSYLFLKLFRKLAVSNTTQNLHYQRNNRFRVQRDHFTKQTGLWERTWQHRIWGLEECTNKPSQKSKHVYFWVKRWLYIFAFLEFFAKFISINIPRTGDSGFKSWPFRRYLGFVYRWLLLSPMVSPLILPFGENIFFNHLILSKSKTIRSAPPKKKGAQPKLCPKQPPNLPPVRCRLNIDPWCVNLLIPTREKWAPSPKADGMVAKIG